METVTISLERYTNMCNQIDKKVRKLEEDLKHAIEVNEKVNKIKNELVQALKEVGIDAKYDGEKVIFTNNHLFTMVRSDKI